MTGAMRPRETPRTLRLEREAWIGGQSASALVVWQQAPQPQLPRRDSSGEPVSGGQWPEIKNQGAGAEIGEKGPLPLAFHNPTVDTPLLTLRPRPHCRATLRCPPSSDRRLQLPRSRTQTASDRPEQRLYLPSAALSPLPSRPAPLVSTPVSSARALRS